MQTVRNLKEYRKEVKEALDNEFLRETLDKFAVAYRTGRANSFAGMDVDALISDIAAAKDQALQNMESLYRQFSARAKEAGVHVHLATTAEDANRIIAGIAQKTNSKKIVKSKSMTAEETLLNHHLEALGIEVTETDLGEWIIQLRHEGPSHMVMPAIHLSRFQVADLFTDVTGKNQDSEIERLVKVARQELRQKYIEADMGISGANFAIADTGTIGIITNEGNARLVTTLPRVHVALVGLDKLAPTLDDALRIIKVLPRNATGQTMTSYVTWITGPNQCAAAPGGKKEMHIVFLDNGRIRMSKDPIFSQVLRCVRCGACANVCPVYRMVGGHHLGHIYIGAIGLISTYFFHGRDKARNLVQNCINCGACKEVCAAGIDLPRLIKEVHARILEDEGRPLPGKLMGLTLKNRKLFHGLLRSAQKVQKPVTGGTAYVRHLPFIFAKDHGFRTLPAIADTPFRDRWKSVRPAQGSVRYRVALFSGCVEDFVYPEQLEAGLKVLSRLPLALDFPMGQTCCGLPLQMMGEKKCAVDVAIQNIEAFEQGSCDYILTLCASCASHLKHAVPQILAHDPAMAMRARRFAARVITFTQFIQNVMDIDPALFQGDNRVTTYHAPCHLCRGLNEHQAPKALISKAGFKFVPAREEETCCGFGGTYSGKFPEISSRILARKLDDINTTGADQLITECPGCVMQLRGGAMKRGDKINVLHIAEAMAQRLVRALDGKY